MAQEQFSVVQAEQQPTKSGDILTISVQFNIIEEQKNGLKTTIHSMQLERENIQFIQFENKFNAVEILGTIIYMDVDGKCDIYLNRPNTYITIDISQTRQSSQDNVQIGHFKHDFIISDVKIFNKTQNGVNYEFHITSKSSFDFSKIISYSSIGKNLDTIDAVKDILVNKVGVKVSNDFSQYKTGVISEYITNGGDGFRTIFKYMMNNAYKNPKLGGNNLIFLFLNTNDNLFHSFTLNQQKPERIININITSKKTGVTGIFEGDTPINLGTINKRDIEQFINSFSNQVYTSYNQEINDFQFEQFQFDDFSNLFSSNNQDAKIQNDIKNISKKSTIYTSEWDDLSFNYVDMFRNIMNYNSPIIEHHGNLSMNPGDRIVVTVPDNENAGEFIELVGSWVVTKVINDINIYNGNIDYKQRLCVMRNSKNGILSDIYGSQNPQKV